MQGLEPKEHELPHNPSNEGTINEEVSSKIGSVAPLSDHAEGEVEIPEECSVPPANPPFTSPYNPLLFELPSKHFIDYFLLIAYPLICTVGDPLAWMQQYLTIHMD
jgi:hypothetical protein